MLLLKYPNIWAYVGHSYSNHHKSGGCYRAAGGHVGSAVVVDMTESEGVGSRSSDGESKEDGEGNNYGTVVPMVVDGPGDG